eukprot:1017240-Rhodomonas_salina.1
MSSVPVERVQTPEPPKMSLAVPSSGSTALSAVSDPVSAEIVTIPPGPMMELHSRLRVMVLSSPCTADDSATVLVGRSCVKVEDWMTTRTELCSARMSLCADAAVSFTVMSTMLFVGTLPPNNETEIVFAFTSKFDHETVPDVGKKCVFAMPKPPSGQHDCAVVVGHDQGPRVAVELQVARGSCLADRDRHLRRDRIGAEEVRLRHGDILPGLVLDSEAGTELDRVPHDARDAEFERFKCFAHHSIADADRDVARGHVSVRPRQHAGHRKELAVTEAHVHARSCL